LGRSGPLEVESERDDRIVCVAQRPVAAGSPATRWTPESRTVLERAEHVVLLFQRVNIYLIEGGLGVVSPVASGSFRPTVL
jgi:hypothetical protein